ncbi:hypothetical protein [Microbulbifer halophilus]
MAILIGLNRWLAARECSKTARESLQSPATAGAAGPERQIAAPVFYDF